MSHLHADKERAKAIIVEIIRQSGGELRNKTNLYKAFWRAHVEYARGHLSGLSRWPIVRMPNGPGIDKFDVLIGELMAEETLVVKHVPVGSVSGFQFVLVGSPDAKAFSDEESEAIRAGVKSVHGKLASTVSTVSHADSRAWAACGNGDHIDVFLDAMSDEDRKAARCTNMNDILSQVQNVSSSLEAAVTLHSGDE